MDEIVKRDTERRWLYDAFAVMLRLRKCLPYLSKASSEHEESHELREKVVMASERASLEARKMRIVYRAFVNRGGLNHSHPIGFWEIGKLAEFGKRNGDKSPWEKRGELPALHTVATGVLPVDDQRGTGVSPVRAHGILPAAGSCYC